MKSNLTVKELIKELSHIDGNKKVVIQYRDAGGDYIGQDNVIYLEECNNMVIL